MDKASGGKPPFPTCSIPSFILISACACTSRELGAVKRLPASEAGKHRDSKQERLPSSPLKEKIKTLIVDDEPLARRNLRLLLDQDPQIEIIGECRNGKEAVKAIEMSRPDLIFLDIQMPEMDGFDVVEQVGAELLQAIVFVTAFDQYALKAFEVHALDYLLKPYDDLRFQQALQRAKSQIETREITKVSKRLIALLEERESRRESASHQKPYLTRLMIKLANRVVLLKVDDSIGLRPTATMLSCTLGARLTFFARKCLILKPNSTRRGSFVFIDR